MRHTSEIQKRFNINQDIPFKIACFLFIILIISAPILFGYDIYIAYVVIPTTIFSIVLCFLYSIANTKNVTSRIEKIFLYLSIFLACIFASIYGVRFFFLSSIDYTRTLLIFISYIATFYIIYRYSSNKSFSLKMLKSISMASLIFISIIAIFAKDLFVFELFKEQSTYYIYISLSALTSLALLILSLQKNYYSSEEFYTETEIKLNLFLSFGYIYLLAFTFFSVKILFSNNLYLIYTYIFSVLLFFLPIIFSKKARQLKYDLRKLFFLIVILTSLIYFFIDNISINNSSDLQYYHFENFLTINADKNIENSNNSSSEIPLFSTITNETGFLGLFIVFFIYVVVFAAYIYGFIKQNGTNIFVLLGISLLPLILYNIWTNQSITNPVISLYLTILIAIALKESFVNNNMIKIN